MREKTTLLSFNKGLVNRSMNPLDQEGILSAGENVILAEGGIKTRPGITLVGTIPTGPVEHCRFQMETTDDPIYTLVNTAAITPWVDAPMNFSQPENYDVAFVPDTTITREGTTSLCFSGLDGVHSTGFFTANNGIDDLSRNRLGGGDLNREWIVSCWFRKWFDSSDLDTDGLGLVVDFYSGVSFGVGYSHKNTTGTITERLRIWGSGDGLGGQATDVYADVTLSKNTWYKFQFQMIDGVYSILLDDVVVASEAATYALPDDDTNEHVILYTECGSDESVVEPYWVDDLCILAGPRTVPVRKMRQVRHPISEKTFIVGQAQYDDGDRIIVNNDALPSTSMTFDRIKYLGRDAGLSSITSLADRTIITEGSAQVPLTFSGCLTDTADDWVYAKAILVSQDGQKYEDISDAVADPDPDTVAQIGGITLSGEVVVICDQAEIEAFHIEMREPNTGVAASKTFVAEASMNDANNFVTQDLGGSIAYWYQDSGELGHFEGAEIDLDESSVVDKGSGKVGLPATAHGLPTDGSATIRIYGTTNYNTDVATVDATSTANEIVITAAYVLEILNTASKCRKRLTLGTGNDCPLVEPGLSVLGTYINTITNDGDGDSEVELDTATTSGAVSGVYGVAVKEGTHVSISQASQDEWSEIFAKSDGTGGTMAGYTVRQVVKASEITTSGTGKVKFTFRAAGYLELAHASIMERDGSTSDGTTMPTQITFDNQAPGFTASGTTKESDVIQFEIDETKTYLVVQDYKYTESVTASNPHINPFYLSGQPYLDYAAYFSQGGGTYAIAQVTAKYGQPWYLYDYSYQTTGVPNLTTGGGYYFKAPTDKIAEESWDLQSVTDYTWQSGQCLGLVKIEAVVSAPITPAGNQLLRTTSTGAADISPADEFIGVTVDEVLEGSAISYHAVSFDDGMTWKVFLASTWTDVCQYDSDASEWQYWDGAAWQTADENDVDTALRQALEDTDNQMDGATLTAITEAEWADDGGVTVHVTPRLNFAALLVPDGDNVPKLYGWDVSYRDTGTTRIEGWKDGEWSQGAGWTDNTVIDGVPWAQSGTITYDGYAPFKADYHVVNEVPGFPFRFRTQGTSDATSITRIRVKAPVQPLQVIGDGQPENCLAFVVYATDTAETNDYMVAVSDNTFTADSTAPFALATTDEAYIGGLRRITDMELTFYAPNANTSTISAAVWNGTSWVSVTVTDGTSSGGKTCAKKGKLTISVPSNVGWKPCIPLDAGLPRGYYVKLTVSAALSSGTKVSDCKIYTIPEPLRKYRHAATVGDRLVLLDATNKRDAAIVSRKYEEYGYTGEDSWECRIGGQDAIQSVIPAWQSLIVGKTSGWFQLLGDDPQSFSFQGVEAARHVPINSECVIKAPMGGDDTGDKYSLLFLNRYGVFAASGLHVDAYYGASRGQTLSGSLNYWDATSVPRICLKNLHLAQGEYWPAKNWALWTLPMITAVGQTEQTSCNRILVFDLSMGAWLPPFTLAMTAIFTAYDYSDGGTQKLGPLRLYGATETGNIYELFNPAATNDDGTEITAWAKTGIISMGTPGETKLLRKGRFFGRCTGGDAPTIAVYADTNTAASDTLTGQGATVNPSGKLVALDYEQTNVEFNFLELKINLNSYTELYGIELEYLPLRTEEGEGLD